MPPDPIRMLTDAIVPRAVDSLDLNEVLGEIDFDKTLEKVDLDAVLARLDLNTLMARIDLNALLARLDLDALLDRVDLNQVVGQIDMDALMARIDVSGIIKRVQVDAIVSATASGLGYRLLDFVRRKLLALDVMVTRLVKRVGRRDIDEPVAHNGLFTGQLAGAASRLFAFLIDFGVVTVLFSASVAIGFFLASLFVGHNLRSTSGGGLWHIIAFVAFAEVYQWVCLVVAGRKLGMAVAGLRVASPDGTPIGSRAATRRVVVYPFSFVLGLGFVGIVVGRRHRALHDVAAPSLVVYDWGDRYAEVGAALAGVVVAAAVEQGGLSGAGQPGTQAGGSPRDNGEIAGEVGPSAEQVAAEVADGSGGSAGAAGAAGAAGTSSPPAAPGPATPPGPAGDA